MQHHLICSHLAVVYDEATVSVETKQVVLNQCQIFHPQSLCN